MLDRGSKRILVSNNQLPVIEDLEANFVAEEADQRFSLFWTGPDWEGNNAVMTASGNWASTARMNSFLDRRRQARLGSSYAEGDYAAWL